MVFDGVLGLLNNHRMPGQVLGIDSRNSTSVGENSIPESPLTLQYRITRDYRIQWTVVGYVLFG